MVLAVWILQQLEPSNDQYWMKISSHPDKDTRTRLMAGQGHVSRRRTVLQAYNYGECMFAWNRHNMDWLCGAWMLLLLSCSVSYLLIVVSG